MKKSKICVIFISLLILSGCQKESITRSVSITDNEIGTYFSKQDHPDRELINVINSSKKNLNVAIYSLTKKDIVQAIIAAKQRGVNVRIITDRQESNSRSENEQIVKIKSAGIEVKINSHPGLMHMKVTIADGNTVTTGSYNYTNNATYENDEVLIVIKNADIAQKFSNQFEKMWNDQNQFIGL